MDGLGVLPFWIESQLKGVRVRLDATINPFSNIQHDVVFYEFGLISYLNRLSLARYPPIHGFQSLYRETTRAN
jgi:hypothetical protein